MGKAVDVFKALSDSTRLKIVEHVLSKKSCVNDICSKVGTSQPNISQHLAVLRKAGIIEVRRKGKACCCKARKPHIVRKVLSLAKEIGGKHES
ncbi:MAG: metalloregulator ArsR/SmtB family transcription factor [Candidatus Micrarchaeota archaeon]|nr:metalloregulator ArsR/SmtB family transcription factor [Candidatus Micrarchaeota archaeon]